MKPITEIRPLIKLKLTRTDYVLEVITVLSFTAMWTIAAISYHQLPETIVTHFGINGQADSFGNKSSIFTLPSIGFLVIIGLSILNRFPHTFNYPVKVTEENALSLYSKGTRMIRIAKVIVSVLFLLIEWQICNMAESTKLPVLFLPLILIIPVVLPIIMAFNLTKISSSGKTT